MLDDVAPYFPLISCRVQPLSVFEVILSRLCRPAPATAAHRSKAEAVGAQSSRDACGDPYAIDGAMDGRRSSPMSSKSSTGDIVFMNNRRTHNILVVREAIETMGTKLRHLPAYSRA